MPTRYQLTNSVGGGDRIRLAAGVDLVVGPAAFLGSTDADGIEAVGGGHSVAIHGDVAGDGAGVRFSGAGDTGNSLRLTAGASVFSVGPAVLFQSDANRLVSRGTLASDEDAIRLAGDGDGLSEIVNQGELDAGGIAVAVTGAATLLLRNAGDILAGGDAVVARAGDDTVVNKGTIVGDIVLGAGDDEVDNRAGSIDGRIAGGSGNDVFRPGAGAETIDGGEGTDTLDFAGGPAVRVALGDTNGTGWADGDSYAGIERVLGSSGSDAIFGGVGSQTLNGRGGADTLSGGGGSDTVVGGAGADRLSGDGGNDAFLYATPDEGGDLVVDFGTAEGNNDRFEFGAAGFGGGLVAGEAVAPAQFVARADNAAQDGNDRFVLRLVDRTLWYDADGNGPDGPVLIADLQAGVNVTAADIVLV